MLDAKVRDVIGASAIVFVVLHACVTITDIKFSILPAPYRGGTGCSLGDENEDHQPGPVAVALATAVTKGVTWMRL